MGDPNDLHSDRGKHESTDPGPTSPLDADDPLVDLLAEFSLALGRGEQPDLKDFEARLPNAEDRAQLRRTAQQMMENRGLMPRTIREGELFAGQFRIVREIGLKVDGTNKGGSGRLWHAIHERRSSMEQAALDATVGPEDGEFEQRDVVLKVLERGGATPESWSTLRREVEALSRVRHRSVVRHFGFHPDENVPVLVIEHIEGSDLAALLEDLSPPAESSASPWPDRERIGSVAPWLSRYGEDWFQIAAKFGHQAAEALAVVHDASICHRDLKPSNLMAGVDGCLKVIDFGLAGLTDEATGAVTRLGAGTFSYWAPEQAESMQLGKDPSSDVYQLGVVLLECLLMTQAFPVTIGDQSEVRPLLQRIRRGDHQRVTALPSGRATWLRWVAARAMEIDPGRRYQSMREMAEDLRRVVDGRPPLHVGRNAVARTSGFLRRQIRRSPKLFRVLTGLALVLVTALTLVLFDEEPTLRFDTEVFLDGTTGVYEAIFSSDSPGTVFAALHVYERDGSSELLGIIPMQTPSGEFAVRYSPGSDGLFQFVTPPGAGPPDTGQYRLAFKAKMVPEAQGAALARLGGNMVQKMLEDGPETGLSQADFEQQVALASATLRGADEDEEPLDPDLFSEQDWAEASIVLR
ncbi:MAG: serine/threonine-protein kinase [Planctomycetota bacterium]